MVDPEVLLICVGIAVTWYLGDEAWKGIHWFGIHAAHVIKHIWNWL